MTGGRGPCSRPQPESATVQPGSVSGKPVKSGKEKGSPIGEPFALLSWGYEETRSLTANVRPSSPRSTRTVSPGPNSPPMMRLLRGFST
jgi:hypothetical protein